MNGQGGETTNYRGERVTERRNLGGPGTCVVDQTLPQTPGAASRGGSQPFGLSLASWRRIKAAVSFDVTAGALSVS